MKNSTSDNTGGKPITTDYSETRALWIGMGLLIALIILDWLSGWQV
jgi:hypothetical protein